jgi:signal transduction histidine kinase
MSHSFYKDFWKTIKEDKKAFSGEIKNKRKNGELYQAEIRVSPVLDKNGNVEFFVALERDITEQKEMEKAKTEFISLAAHQLKTPLTAISLTTEMLLKGIDGNMSNENKKHLKNIFMEVKDMAQLIEIFLNVSRVEMGKFPIQTEKVCLYEVIEKTANGIMPQMKAKKINFVKEYNENLPFLNLDRRVMNIILENLLSNALKYTLAKGTIKLCVEINSKNALIKVIDSGIGIPIQEQSKIFQKMFRTSNASSIKSEGSGLGLYLIKNLAKQRGYDISFVSVEKEGTTFILSIPLNTKIVKRKLVDITNDNL